jgi:hypothetical protein
MDLMNQKEIITEKKGLHHEIRKKGYILNYKVRNEFLIGVELQNDPSIELIKNQIKFDAEKYREDFPVSEIIEKSKFIVKNS